MMSLELKAPEHMFLPLTHDDIPPSPTRLPQWRPASPSSPTTPLAPTRPSVSISSILRRVLSELLIVVCLSLWCTLIAFLASLIFGGFGVALLKADHHHANGPLIQVGSGRGTMAAFIGCAIVSSGIACVAHALWIVTHLDEEPVKLGDGHPLVWPVSFAAVLAGAFSPPLGVALYAKHLLNPLEYTALVALKVYGLGIAFLVGMMLALAGIIWLGAALCGS
ncbi:hypothetical protein BC628DRAFT_1046159 [Trametes gibbosa]|nr:hypothetical protein BC628DRAFT_1046159 [Trametes gibbosa]